MATATKKALEMAFKAGKASVNIQWDDTVHAAVPEEKRVPGVHHNPFDKRDPEQVEEYEAWLKGLKKGLQRPEIDTKSIIAQIDKEVS